MYGNPQTFIFATLFSVAIYWALPSSWTGARAALLIGVSAVLIMSVSPLALLAVFVITLTGYGAVNLVHIRRSKAVAWGGVALIVAEYLFLQHMGALKVGSTSNFAVVLGLSYVCFRTISVVLSAHQYRRSSAPLPTVADMVLLNIFYPIVPSGPIEKLENLRIELLGAAFDLDRALYGVMRLLIGIFVVHYVGDAMILPRMQQMQPIYYGTDAGATMLGAAGFCVVSLLYLYFNFAGFMSVAVGVGALFGLRISENFNWPFLALNIQDFWKRWHITLGDFATKHIYFPILQVLGGHPYVSIFITFILIGLWHKISWTFLIWGAAHGAALVLHAWLASRELSQPSVRSIWILRRALNWAATMFFVCWAWTFANAPSTEAAFRMTGLLLGIQQ